MARREIRPTTELGRQLEKERANLGLTRQGMADHLGVSKPTYLSWLRGGNPEPQNLKVLADKLSVPIGEVMRWVLGGLLVITWSEGDTVSEKWYPRPIDIMVDHRAMVDDGSELLGLEAA